MPEKMTRTGNGEMSWPDADDHFFEFVSEMTDLELLDFLERGCAAFDFAADAALVSIGEKADTLQLKVIRCSE